MKYNTSLITLKSDLAMNGCRICGIHVAWTRGGFVRHLKHAHIDVTPQSYYEDKVIGFRSLCECGCGKKTEWQCRGGFYQRYVNGHNYRGKSKMTDVTVVTRTAKAIQHPNMRSSWFRKGHKTWNVGLKLGDNSTWDEACRKSNETKAQWSDNFKLQVFTKISETARRNYQLGIRVSPFAIATDQQRAIWALQATETRARQGCHNSQRGFENGWYHSTKDGRNHHYESSWERQRMELLDADETVQSWKKCDWSIYYWSTEKNKIRRYTPDFLIRYTDQRHVIEEVKGWITQDTIDKAFAGMAYANKRGWNYLLITKSNKGKGPFVELEYV